MRLAHGRTAAPQRDRPLTRGLAAPQTVTPLTPGTAEPQTVTPLTRGTEAPRRPAAGVGDRRADDLQPGYLMNSISEYLGSGHRSSGTSFSRRSATSRTSAIASSTVSRM
jgi:hypothetical protein